VSVSTQDGTLVMQIADSGMGFDAGARLSEGLGLVSMRERVHYLGGRFEIVSARGKGTRLVVQVPLRATAIDERESGRQRRASA
jgi:signal transduction histidine kinase